MGTILPSGAREDYVRRCHRGNSKYIGAGVVTGLIVGGQWQGQWDKRGAEWEKLSQPQESLPILSHAL